MKNFKIGKLEIEASAYGSSGNAILGIRDSGKTYTATLIAEKLFEAGIPFIAFDPIGVWRFLRVPGKGKGYPVVVAGGQEGDLPLTVAGAPEIVRAAMRSGVSLVIDLFDMNLSKADWKRIVTSCVKVLLHENSKFGLRHIFLEEAAEFAPQRVGPDQGQVYAEIEKLARMGGNSRLGYTLINQRSEEVNKAVLELCDNLFLHRQKGRNSLTALSKWLDVGNVKGFKEIIGSLATLPSGQCWAWLRGSEIPALIKVQEKNSLHPDRRAQHGETAAKLKAAVDVNSFVKDMKSSLQAVEKEAAANDPTQLKKRVAELEKQLKGKGAPVADMEMIEKGRKLGAEEGRKTGFIDGYEQGAADEKFAWVKSARTLQERPINIPRPAYKKQPESKPLPQQKVVSKARVTMQQDGKSFTGPERKIIKSLSFWKSIGHDAPSKDQVAAVAGYSAVGGSFGNPISALRTAGVIEYPQPGKVSLIVDTGDAMTQSEARDMMLSILGGPEKKIIDVFLQREGILSRDEVAQQAGYSPIGGSFGNPASRLSTLGIISRPQPGMMQMTDWAREVLG